MIVSSNTLRERQKKNRNRLGLNVVPLIRVKFLDHGVVYGDFDDELFHCFI